MCRKIVCLLFFFVTLTLPFIVKGKLIFEQEHINIKAIPTDEETEIVYSFKNKGKRTIEILRVKPSCGCTIANLDKKVYQPEKSGQIKVTFKHGGRVGRMDHEILVLTNELFNASYSLLLTIEIPKIIDVSPRFLLWRKKEALESKTITLKTVSDETIENITVLQDNPAFQIETESIQEKRLYLLKVTPPERATLAQGLITVDILFSSGLKRSYRCYARLQ